mgnify:FL=1
MIGPKFYGFGKDGKPLAFGKLYTYQARTNTPKDTYQSEDQVVANTNPVILNGEGYANIYLDGSYKVVLKDSDENEIWSADPVTAQGGEEWVNCHAATYLTATSFKVASNITDNYEAGRRIRIDNNTTSYSYSTVVSSVFAGGETTIVITDPVILVGVVGVCSSIIGLESINDQSINDLSQAYEFTLLNDAVIFSKLIEKKVLHIKGRTTANVGTGIWDVITKGTTVNVDLPNGLNIVACTGVPSLALVLRNNDDGTMSLLAAGIVADNATDQKAAVENVSNSSTGDLVLPSQALKLNLSAAPNIGAKTVRMSKFDQVNSNILEDMQATITEAGKTGGVPQASTFKKWGFEFFGGVVRKEALGTDQWLFISTTQGFPGHEPIGFDPAIKYTAVATSLALPFNIPAGVDVVTALTGPDEYLAAFGLTVGASVGVADITLKMSFDNKLARKVRYNGVDFDLTDIYGGLNDVTVAIVSPNVLRFTHSRMTVPDYNFQSVGAAIPHLATIKSFPNAYTFDVKFLDLVAGALNPSFSTQHDFNLFMKERTVMNLNGSYGGAASDVGDKILTTGNIWIYGVMRSV